MYKLFKNKTDKQLVIRTEDNAFIPFDEQNSDYQAYLKFIADGGQPLPADEVTA